jgi:hypothetical protein
MASRGRAGVSSAAELLSGGLDSSGSSSVESLIAEAGRTIEALLVHTQDSVAVAPSNEFAECNKPPITLPNRSPNWTILRYYAR